ncbi:hypothetical protein SAMN06297229_1446 [Pseudidiomarina planktonica]|uniref:Uncharacterized protein n=1 Tax=Pseudidiomarina planktonica TaxID=1323738 RepID=A0A1Y6ETR1_9GAMM|nr:hypothetical protein [Pseudidiomarina planktonica]RUO65185.1 hypothetical protein CWI77_01540 [Pseudidiomarina planktonica]SMQ66128.1 hypothetical protein SAMN06297229_1446 [Pseudidiomarina planktonica]
MILSLLVVVIGFAALISGIYEQSLLAMILGAGLMLIGWGVFRWRWHQQKSSKQPADRPAETPASSSDKNDDNQNN